MNLVIQIVFGTYLIEHRSKRRVGHVDCCDFRRNQVVAVRKSSAGLFFNGIKDSGQWRFVEFYGYIIRGESHYGTNPENE